MFKLVERYLTLGGEAPITGHPVYIVRFSGCNLHCTYCDSRYHVEENEIFTESDLMALIRKQGERYPGLKILFTGGEPLLNERQDALINLISDTPNMAFYIETNGSIPLAGRSPSNCHYVADWKAPSSGEGHSFCHENLEQFMVGRDCIKFVVRRPDLPWLLARTQQVEKIKPGLPLYVSPQWGSMELKELADFILRHRLQLNLSLQLHKIIWPPDTRGV